MASPALMKRIMEMIEAEQAGKGGGHTNYGTSNSFNNHGNGSQDFANASITGSSNVGNRNWHRATNNHNGRTINNSGTFTGNGNGGFIEGGFDSSTKNYYGGRY